MKYLFEHDFKNIYLCYMYKQSVIYVVIEKLLDKFTPNYCIIIEGMMHTATTLIADLSLLISNSVNQKTCNTTI